MNSPNARQRDDGASVGVLTRQHTPLPQPGRMASSSPQEECEYLRSEMVQVLENVSKDTRELLLGNHVQTYDTCMTSVCFLRDHVGPSRPCVVRDELTVRTWPARTTWSDDQYLLETLRDVSVTAALTPNGLADCPVSDVERYGLMTDDACAFALPQYSPMSFESFYDALLHQKKSVSIPYLQQQNSSLTSELSALLHDVQEIPWAKESLPSLEATNFWMGRWPSKTSWHRDPFENIYVVLRGSKIVRLLPPTDSYRMKMKVYSQATWCRHEHSTWTLKPHQGDAILWSSLMPCSCLESRKSHGICDSCKHLSPRGPLEVEVTAGDVLYIPATWYHEIHHKEACEEPTIAINFWYDMIHDTKYATMLAIDKMSQVLGMSESL